MFIYITIYTIGEQLIIYIQASMWTTFQIEGSFLAWRVPVLGVGYACNLEALDG